MDRYYREDLAHIHDAGFGDFARAASPGLLEILSRARITDGLVVDLGCGSGLWARALCDAGYDVLGIDISPAMIELARRRAPEARFIAASIWSAELPPCAAVTSLGECLNYLFDEEAGAPPTPPGAAAAGRGGAAPALGRLFRRVHRALRRGGIFVFDVAEPGQVRGPAPRRGFREAEDWSVLVEVEEDPRKNVLTRRITTFRKRAAGNASLADLYWRDTEVHRQRLYEKPEVSAALASAGFRVRVRRSYGTYRLAPSHLAFLARKS